MRAGLLDVWRVLYLISVIGRFVFQRRPGGLMCSVKSLTKVLQKYSHQGVVQARRVLLLWLAVILTAVAITNSASTFDNSLQSVPFIPETASLSPAKATYPLKVSANNRYLV